MSTFDGLLQDEDLRFISIDCFEKHRHSCTIFLLSHIHTDHTRGLFYGEHSFADVINNSSTKYIYCSPITRKLIEENRYNKINSNKIKSIDVWEQVTLYSPSSNCQSPIVITALPAKHCMGSVMFLIEYDFKRILFASDFRFQLDDFKKFCGMINHDGNIIKIDDLYIDTTFADEKYLYFPSRDESISRIISIIKHWMTENYDIKILIDLPCKFGMEYLFKQLYKEFKRPVHVDQDSYNHYSYIEEMDSYVTAKLDNTFIHACISRKCYIRSSMNKSIKPCALSFCGTNKTLEFVDENRAKVCYSSHCSLSEIKELVNFIKPNKIIPLVVSEDMGYTVEGILSSIGYTEKERKNNIETMECKSIERNFTLEDNVSYRKTIEQRKCNVQELYQMLGLNE